MFDTLVYGNIYTMDLRKPEAEVIGIKDGKIRFCGTRRASSLLKAKRTLDFRGKTILPGFIDTHVHVIPAGIFMKGADLSKAKTVSDVLDLLRENAGKTAPKDWILGAYFQDKLIAEKRFPTKEELDAVSKDRPVLICHNDLHPIAFNTKALEILKVRPDKPGVITDENGEMTGQVEDPGCVDMLADILAKMGIASILDGIFLVDDYAAAHGVTTVFGKDVLDILLLREIAKDLFKIEFVPMWYSDGCRDLASLEKFLKNKMFAGRACVCAFADGAFDGHSAALAEPYTDRPDTKGILNYSDEEMYAFTMTAHRAGAQVSFHAIGDAAVDQVLRVYERVLADCPREDHRLRIEHFEEPTKEAIEKAASLRVALSMQPLLLEVCEKMDFSGYAGFIGDRVLRCSPYRSVLDHGLLVGGGTDFPVTPMDVLHGAKIAMTHPVESERITLQECLEMNTSEAAKLGFLENRKGRLAFGLDADFIVLDQDPYAVETDALDGIKIEKTFRGGRCVFDAEDRKPHKKRSLPGVLLRIAGKKLRLPVG